MTPTNNKGFLGGLASGDKALSRINSQIKLGYTPQPQIQSGSWYPNQPSLMHRNSGHHTSNQMAKFQTSAFSSGGYNNNSVYYYNNMNNNSLQYFNETTPFSLRDNRS